MLVLHSTAIVSRLENNDRWHVTELKWGGFDDLRCMK